VDPGSVITYNINITNEGNGKDFVIITPTMLEVNWEATFYFDGEERVTHELLINETLRFELQIVIPKDQLAGTFTTAINVTSIGDREINSFDTKINKVYNLSAYGVVHSEHTSDKELNSTIKLEPGVSPGSILNYVFEVTNGGNDADWIDVNFYPMKPTSMRQAEDLTIAQWSEFEEIGWEAYLLGITNTEAYLTEVEDLDFSEDFDISHQTAPVAYLNDGNTSIRNMKLNLGVGQTIWVKVQLTIPRDVPDTHDLHPDSEEPWYFRFECQSADPIGKNIDINLEDNEVMIINKILLPDLIVYKKKSGDSGINYPSSFESGTIVTISAEIKNIGEIAAREVIVTFYVDGKEVRSQTINILDKGQSRLVPFTWETVSGDHDLKISVDPENAIVEKNEKNNEATAKVGIESGGFLEILSNREFCSVLPIIILVVILAIIIIIIKKRGDFFGLKPGGGEEI
jgi:hypothetical protein